MIGRLSGCLQVKTPSLLLLDVNGVGYEVFIPMSSYYPLPEIGAPLTLLIHHYIREDAHVLYGFCEEQERALFRALIKISGVGPKMALAILSGMDVPTFLRCVEHRDLNLLTRLPGVGKKTAERLVVEMAGKLKLMSAPSSSEERALLHKIADPMSISPQEEATEALIALGYKPQEAIKAITRVIEDCQGAASHDIIRRALQNFAKV